MTAQAAIDRGRDQFARRAWEDAYQSLSEADAQDELAGIALEELAWSCALTARDDECLAALERLYTLAEASADPAAARYAFWLGLRLMSMGEVGRGSAWLARSQRALEQDGGDRVEAGYLLLPQVQRKLAAGDNEAAAALAASAVKVGERFHDTDLMALARNLEGRARVRLGDVEAGLARIDEAMLAATAGELSPVVTGLVYCTVISTCQQVYALDRAREWTEALSTWCQAQPQLVLFTGSCLVHRAEILQLGGDWQSAIDEAARACERVSPKYDREALADACYQRAEIHRLRGELEAAEGAYREASRHGREPQPGLALLRLAQGRRDDALGALRRTVEATSSRLMRARHLPAYVEVALACSELPRAEKAASELSQLATDYDIEALHAMAAHASGAVLLARGDATGALSPLRRAFALWQRLDAPYLAARIRVLLARACHALDDCDSALLELDAAREVFEELGARADLQALEAAAPDLATRPARTSQRTTPAGQPGHGNAAPAPAVEHGLTPRELEVLRLVAAGKTNKAVAKELFVSEKTVDRHVSNIFGKIGVSTRAAATAYAYENGLV